MHINGTSVLDRPAVVVPGFGREVTDETLVKTVLAGDSDAYGELYRRYADRVAGYVAKRTPPQAPREDLVQEAFAQALEHLGEFEDSEFVFGQWLCGMAGRVLFKHTKSWWIARQAEEVSADALERELRDGPARPAGEVALSAELAGKVAALRPHYRRVVELFYLDGLSQEQTAEVMGIPVDAVNNHLAAARAELRNPGKRKKYAPETSARLIEAARQLVAERGVKGAKGCLIAERAGVSPASINVRFGSRAALIALVTQEENAPVAVLGTSGKRESWTRARLLDAAGQLIAERGVETVNGRLIAKQAGVNPSRINYHFGSCAELIALVTGEQVAA